MKKKWIWGAAVVLVLALSLGLYRFFTADDYRRTLPSRPLALAAVDWVRLSEENDMGMQDWKKLLPEGLEPDRPESTGRRKCMPLFLPKNTWACWRPSATRQTCGVCWMRPQRKAGARLWKTIGATLGRYGTAVGWWVSVTVRCL